MGSQCHVVAESVGKISRIDTRVYPAPNAISNAKSYGAGVVDPADKESIVARFGTGGRSTVSWRLNSIIRIEVKDVARRIVWSVLCNEGRCDVI